jgi:WD40 repeat protein
MMKEATQHGITYLDQVPAKARNQRRPSPPLMRDCPSIEHGGIRFHQLAISPNIELVAGGFEDGHLRIWDRTTGALRYEFEHESPIDALSFSKDRRWIASGYSDGSAAVWDLKEGQMALHLRNHKYGVQSVAFSPDNKFLATSSRDRTVRIWDLTGLDESSGEVLQ